MRGITIKPMGGLGNQLFQYAMGRKSAVAWGVPLYGDLTYYSQSSLRSYQLDSFASSIKPRPIGVVEDIGNKTLSLLDSLRTDAAHETEPLFLGIARERRHGYHNRFANLPSIATLRGYFQSWKYLKGQEADLRKELTSLSLPSDWFLSEVKALTNLGPFTAVHLRFTDYLLDPNFGHLTNHYYATALGHLGADSQPVVVFSDDPSRAGESPFIKNAGKRRLIFINPPADSRPIESMNLMALASDIIISNSTFSWWGAWLGEPNNGGSVIAPAPWLASGEFCQEDLIPQSWISLPATASSTHDD